MMRYGKVSLNPHHAVVGTMTTWTLSYHLGEVAFEPKGRLRVGIMGRMCCNDLQVVDPRQAEYVSATTSREDVKASLPGHLVRNGPLYWEVTAEITGNLSEGDRIVLTYGDRSGGGPGFTVKRHVQKLRILVSIDPDGSGNYHPIPDVGRMTFQADQPERLIVLVPSDSWTEAGIAVKAVDQYQNPVAEYTGHPRLFLQSEAENRPLEDTAGSRSPEGSLIFRLPRLDLKPGTYTVLAEDRENGLTGLSNPLIISEEVTGIRRYWGEIHGQTLMSDGQLDPDEYYRYARDVERLDFSAITDHDTHMMRREVGGKDRYLFTPFWREPHEPWHIIKYETNRFHAPGQFVTLLGFEWTSGHCFTPRELSFGHKNVYYLSEDEPLYSHVDLESDTPRKLFSLLASKACLVIPHHTVRPIDNQDVSDVNTIVSGNKWIHHNPERERLVEIYSKWGNSEQHDGPRPVVSAQPEGSVQNALLMGCRLGFTGGSDTHASGPGSAVLEDESFLPYRSGLTAVLASELTRQSIFDALYHRRCYATSGERIYLDFQLNGHCMGSEITAGPSPCPRTISFRVAGTSPLQTIEVIRNGQVLHRSPGTERELAGAWTDQDDLAQLWLPSRITRGEWFVFYYLRVTQQDGEMAWASPIWFLKNS